MGIKCEHWAEYKDHILHLWERNNEVKVTQGKKHCIPSKTWQPTLSDSGVSGTNTTPQLLSKYLSRSSELSPLQYLCISNCKGNSAESNSY